MDLDRIKALIDLVAAAPIADLQVEEGPLKIRITKRAPAAGNGMAAEPAARPAAPPSPAATPPAAAAPSQGPPQEPSPAVDAVLSPMLGTFYRAPSPDAPPFVSVGDMVEAGQTLAVIEAMKTLIKVEAAKAGTLREILAENGQPVEESQPLFVIA
ncbi:acetyl-CoA carboxylase biotin carboxyl carrier protein [Teichococcus oryzae]|uniref:Biotin carboxyl carrier protein of acetyl-CoA carboxylase n=1 Tax=Teichococcus oryzae TaxID=1608942 RepID=A0A5B2TFT2_9PROT|nr:acetyl-CoA carboxylase biotin carboxyl carrier protein [Pseudoroseomonas oryzae]KAA2212973.1 acetyl-CoA carboxylase biotin carboxyl carrier protein [Pseudoroseomonas oryzae]